MQLPPGVTVNPHTSNGDFRNDVAHLYSAYLLPTSLTKGEYPLFQVNVNAAGQGSGSNALTYVETNMENAGRIPDQTSWVITDMGVGFNTSVALADLKKVIDNSYVVFTKPGFQRVLGPSFMWGSGWGLSGSTTANNETSWSNGPNSPRLARRKLGSPIVLNKGSTFGFSLFVGNSNYSTLTLSATTWVWIDLWGSFVQTIAQ